MTDRLPDQLDSEARTRHLSDGDLVASRRGVDWSSAFTLTDDDVNEKVTVDLTAVGVTDHGALTGLSDDDHPQYALADGSRGTFQPLDSDLTAIAALSTTSFGRALLALADAAAGRGALSLGTAATSATGDFEAAGTAILKTTVNAKGDLISATADNTPSIVTAGANDSILMADSSATSGLKWAAAATPSTQAIGDAAAEGTADTFTRGDHKHAMPAFATNAVVLGSAAAAGAAATLIRSDATIAAFDATAPTTQAVGDSAAVGTAAFAARRDHKHEMPTFGTGATNITAGNDSRLSDSRAPNGSAGGDLTGTYPNPTLATAGPGATGPLGGATVAPIVTIDAKGRVTALSSTTITGVTPATHAASHLPGGTDALTVATPGNSAIGDTAAAGSAASFARSDHTHGREDLAQSLTVPATDETLGVNYCAVIVEEYIMDSSHELIFSDPSEMAVI